MLHSSEFNLSVYTEDTVLLSTWWRLHPQLETLQAILKGGKTLQIHGCFSSPGKK